MNEAERLAFHAGYEKGGEDSLEPYDSEKAEEAWKAYAARRADHSRRPDTPPPPAEGEVSHIHGCDCEECVAYRLRRESPSTPSSAECNIEGGASRTCERGARGCTIRHESLPCAGVDVDAGEPRESNPMEVPRTAEAPPDRFNGLRFEHVGTEDHLVTCGFCGCRTSGFGLACCERGTEAQRLLREQARPIVEMYTLGDPNAEPVGGPAYFEAGSVVRVESSDGLRRLEAAPGTLEAAFVKAYAYFLRQCWTDLNVAEADEQREACISLFAEVKWLFDERRRNEASPCPHPEHLRQECQYEHIVSGGKSTVATWCGGCGALKLGGRWHEPQRRERATKGGNDGGDEGRQSEALRDELRRVDAGADARRGGGRDAARADEAPRDEEGTARADGPEESAPQALTASADNASHTEWHRAYRARQLGTQAVRDLADEVRRETIEECARLADYTAAGYPHDGDCYGLKKRACEEVAARIRGLSALRTGKEGT